MLISLRHKKNKTYSLKSLVGMALQKWDSEAYWNIIHKIRVRATAETVQLAFKLSKSHNWRKRVSGANIICQLIQKDQSMQYCPYAVEYAHKILCAALSDNNLQVVTAAIYGLGYRPFSDALPSIVNYAVNHNVEVRLAVAFALGYYKDEESIKALLHLAIDKDDEVRDWATFSIGAMHQDLDTPAIREMLWRNTMDSYDIVRGEAISGLAVRKDLRVIEILKKRLTEDDCMVYELEAAEFLAEPLLYSYLKQLWERFHAEAKDKFWLYCLEKAMNTCHQK